MSKKHLGEGKCDRSIYVPQREKVKEVFEIRERFNFTDKQKKFIELALNKDVKALLVNGLWGTAKTYLAVYCALKLLRDKKIDGIVYIRSPVCAGKQLGFLAGNILEKMAPFSAPFYEKLDELLDKSTIAKLTKEERFTILPVGFTRGLSINCKAIIIDEASSLTRDELELVFSRIGRFTKVFIVGSDRQSDIKSNEGFVDLVNLFNDEESRNNGIHVMEFNDESDILRSDLLRFIMKKIGALD